MNIGMILEHPYPEDIRVTKEAAALTQAAHDVHLLCPVRDGTESLSEATEHLTIHRFPYKPTPLMGGRSLQYVLTFHDRQWHQAIYDFAKNIGAEVLHVHDIPLARICMTVKRTLKIPVVVDMHEFYSEGLRNWYKPVHLHIGTSAWQRLKSCTIRNPARFEKMETRTLHEADHIVAVIDEAKDELVRRKRLSPDRISVIRNTVDPERFNAYPIDQEITARYQDDEVILYVGGLGPHRGIEIAIQAMPEIIPKMKNAKLLIVGDGQSKATLKTLIRRLRLTAHVELLGRQPFAKVRSYIHASRICLVPHLKSGHTDTTIPHKLFQYMSQGKPVVVSDAAPLKRIVKETGAGLVFPSGDAGMLAKVCLRLSDRDLASTMGLAGKSACDKKYNWKKDARNLHKIYKTLL